MTTPARDPLFWLTEAEKSLLATAKLDRDEIFAAYITGMQDSVSHGRVGEMLRRRLAKLDGFLAERLPADMEAKWKDERAALISVLKQGTEAAADTDTVRRRLLERIRAWCAPYAAGKPAVTIPDEDLLMHRAGLAHFLNGSPSTYILWVGEQRTAFVRAGHAYHWDEFCEWLLASVPNTVAA